MGDLVCDGTVFTCPHCTSQLKLKVPSSVALGDAKPIANTVNSSFPPPGGQCLVTLAPCSPDVKVADPGQEVVQIDGKPALGSGCQFSCSNGGTVTVSSSGQPVAQSLNPYQGEKPEDPPAQKPSCSVIRQNVLTKAAALRDQKDIIKYSEKPGERTGPTSYDCSGFVHHVYKEANAPYGPNDPTRPPTVKDIWMFYTGPNGPFKKIPNEEVQPGDLIVWFKNEGNSDNHIAIYEGTKEATLKVMKKGKVIVLHGIDAAVISTSSSANTFHENAIKDILIKWFPGKIHHTLRWIRCQE